MRAVGFGTESDARVRAQARQLSVQQAAGASTGAGGGGHSCGPVRRAFPRGQELQLRTQREGSFSVIENLLATAPAEGGLFSDPKPRVSRLSVLLEDPGIIPDSFA